MKHYTLKNQRDSLAMPVLALGTATFEDFALEHTYFEILDKFYALGGRCIDTARAYCAWAENGADVSETVIGRWMAARGNRGEIILVTKGAHPDQIGGAPRVNAQALESDLARSLEALGTDCVDVYLVHRDDPKVPVAEIMPTLDGFVKAGKVRFIGASNWKTERIAEANAFAAENGLEPFRVSQICYSLAHASTDMFGDDTLAVMDSKEYAWYEKNQFPVMAFSPQAKGFFSKLAKGESVSQLMEGQFASAANLARLARVKLLSEKTGYSPAVITLGYLSSQAFPVTSVFAVSKLWQLEEDMAAQDLSFDRSVTAQLENMI
ncbi:MAG: aldo/keto reductase [Oscillospiraceae bacterium]